MEQSTTLNYPYPGANHDSRASQNPESQQLPPHTHRQSVMCALQEPTLRSNRPQFSSAEYLRDLPPSTRFHPLSASVQYSPGMERSISAQAASDYPRYRQQDSSPRRQRTALISSPPVASDSGVHNSHLEHSQALVGESYMALQQPAPAYPFPNASSYTTGQQYSNTRMASHESSRPAQSATMPSISPTPQGYEAFSSSRNRQSLYLDTLSDRRTPDDMLVLDPSTRYAY